MKANVLGAATNSGIERTRTMMRKVPKARAILLAATTVALGASLAAGQSVPNVVMSQVTTLAALPNGGALSGGNPAGSSMAVDPAGDLFLSTTYGNTLVEYAAGSTTATKLGSFSNIGPVAIDSAGNLYLGNTYNTTVVKIPLVSGTYAAVSDPSSSTPACTGSDTAECKLPFSAPVAGLVAMVFDSAGDLFFTSTSGGTDPNSVFECTAACVATGTPAPALLYSEPAANVTEGSSTAAWSIGSIAVDPWGDVFFTDSLFDNGGSASSKNYTSTVKELTYSGGSYSSTPTTIDYVGRHFAREL